MPSKQQVVEKLINLLQSNQRLKDALKTSLQKAQQPGIETLEEFYNYLDGILTHIPTEEDLMPSVRQFYFVLSKSPADILRKDESFNGWINEFVLSRGSFMDSAQSTETLGSFIKNPEYKIDDYIKNPSGWLTYNQFLARQLKPGKRPIQERCNDSIVVFPADSDYKGQWPIEEDSTITVKGITYSVVDLFKDSTYGDKFKGGIFTHSFLNITDYHR
jgi:phosphatidylserine decarboxylase